MLGPIGIVLLAILKVMRGWKWTTVARKMNPLWVMRLYSSCCIFFCFI